MSNMVVATNTLALNAHRSLKQVGELQSTASARLASGNRINSAADDAAGLAISQKMTAQIRGLDQASKNAQDGQSMCQTAEGGMQQIGEMAQRIRELVVQASNDSNDTATGDRTKIQTEITGLVSEVGSMSSRVQFNNKTLLTGKFSASASSITLQVGANAGQTLLFNIGSMTATSLKLATKFVNVSTAKTTASISAMISFANYAVQHVSDERAKLGAIQNRLSYTTKSLDISSQNLSASKSRISDTDMAAEMMNLTKANVLQQAATSMLSQANQAPQNVLQLLR